MTREHKLALIVGFALVLVLGVLISDHFSKARQVEMAGATDIKPPTARDMGAGSNGARLIPAGIAGSQQPPVAGRNDLVQLPGVMPLPQDPANSRQLAMGGGGAPSPLVSTREVAPYPAPDGYHNDPGTNNVPQSTPAVAQIPLTRYDVKEGDTLYRIASKTYGDAKLWEKIRDYNKEKLGSGGALRQGVTLLLPPKDVLLGKPYTPPTAPIQQIGQQPGQFTSPSTLRGDQPPAQTPIAAKSTDFKEYVVKEGDTLTAIARKQLNSGKRFAEIIEANKGTLDDPESLTVGMKLRIPAK